MRKRLKLMLSLAVVVMAIGATGLSRVLAGAPPSSGTPTALSTYGTIVISTTVTTSGSADAVSVDIVSSAGPFYVEKLNVVSLWFLLIGNLYLYQVVYDSSLLTGFDQTGSGSVVNCPGVVTKGNSFGDAIHQVPFFITDPTGTKAVPAANEVTFVFGYNGCSRSAFPNGIVLGFETTVLAPTSATVSICAANGNNEFACSS